MKTLFKIAGFTPYILIIFLNAMTDLGHKIILQNTIFKAYEGAELIQLTALVNALILLPFIFLFLPSGYLSDKYAKPKIIEYASLLAVLITILILISYTMGWFWVAFGLTFVLAAQSAIYSPAKYGLIKEMTGEKKLAQGNALVQAVTIVSILLGAVVYSVFFEYLLAQRSTVPSQILQYIAPVAYLLIAASIVEYLLARRLVNIFKNRASLQTNKERTFPSLKKNLTLIKKDSTIWLSILGLSLLWAVAQVLLAIFGEYLKSHLGVDDTVVAQGLLALTGVGIVIGSIFAGDVCRDYIEKGLIPLGAFGLSLMLFLIPNLDSLLSLGFALLGFGFFAGFIIVPLNTLIQSNAPSRDLGEVLAGNNFMQNIFMFTFLLLTASFGFYDIPSEGLFYITAFMVLIAALFTAKNLGKPMARLIVKILFSMRYKLYVDGLKNIPTDKGVLLLGNHVSFIDGIVMQMACPQQVRFVIDRFYYEKWYFKPLLDFIGVIPISTKGSRQALSAVSDALNNGDVVALFPEGHLSYNGNLDTFNKGFSLATKDVKNAVIVPFYMHGLWEDSFSYASKKTKNKKNRNLNMVFGKEMTIESTPAQVKQEVFNLSIKAWDRDSQKRPCVQKTWVDTSKKAGSSLCIADSTGVKMSANRFMTAVFMMASILKKQVASNQNVGVILPTSAGGALGNMALLTLGKTVVDLNYSSGDKSLKYAIDLVNITHVVTSKKFIVKLKAKGFDLTEVLKGVEVIYLEDVKTHISKIKGLLTLLFVKIAPASLLSFIYVKGSKNDDTVAILFSSGSEGTPKGIELSHKNILANTKQASTLLNATDKDVLLGTLPIFHCFGFTVTMMMPLLENVPVVCHPDPTDGVAIGKISAQYRATILLATSTFLRLYTKNRKVLPLMFKDIRMVVAGAEKLIPSVREAFSKKFNLIVYEGYGATESSPVASGNMEDMLMMDEWRVQQSQKIGTVGLPLPGTNFKIVDPQTYEPLPPEEDGMILIGGPQVMKGYFKNPEKTKSVIKEIDGIRWYVTGDKGHIDEHGFLTIIDRYSRFAKIGGEMVSLGLVESEISKLLGEDEQIAITAIPDEKKGEKLLLLLEGALHIDELKEMVKSLKLNPLFTPSHYFKVDSLPKLGTGKADFSEVKRLALKLFDIGR